MIWLVEHFYSIQGEGRYIGVPSLFFRFGGCNMRCEGFGCKEETPKGEIITGCDTVYAVDRSFSLLWTPVKSTDELVAVMQSYDLPENADVVFTGGEPLVYANDPILIEFLEYLHARSHRVTFETNATIAPNFAKHPVFSSCIYALSVKLQNSKEPRERRFKPETVSAIAISAKESFFKFSVDQASINASLDDEIEEITQVAPNLEVFCMPVGGSKKEIEKNTPSLVEYCKERGYTFSDRLHIRLWDANKGV